MNEQIFWDIVGAARTQAGDDIEARVDALEAALDVLSMAEIQDFQHQYDAMIRRAYRWDLWGAAYLMNEGCSDDGFRYFSDWLISEGKDTYEAALANPDSLAEIADQEYFELESFGYVALKVFEAKGGGELERDFSTELSMPAGDEWEEDALPGMFPRLAARFG